MSFYKHIVFFFLMPVCILAQTDSSHFLQPSDTLNKSRRNFVIITEASLATMSLIGLNELWYNDFERSKFRTIDDFDEWLQLDKFGHVYSSYHLGRIGAEALNWSGVSKKDQLRRMIDYFFDTF